MKQPKYEVKISPQLEIACGLDIHNDTIFRLEGTYEFSKGDNRSCPEANEVIYDTFREEREYTEGGLAHYLHVKKNVREAVSMQATRLQNHEVNA